MIFLMLKGVWGEADHIRRHGLLNPVIQRAYISIVKIII